MGGEGLVKFLLVTRVEDLKKAIEGSIKVQCVACEADCWEGPDGCESKAPRLCHNCFRAWMQAFTTTPPRQGVARD